METRKLIKEKLEFHKRQTLTNQILNKSAKHLFDAYREIELASQFCDNPEMSDRLENIKNMLGRTLDTSIAIESSEPTVISKLQELMNDFKS